MSAESAELVSPTWRSATGAETLRSGTRTWPTFPCSSYSKQLLTTCDGPGRCSVCWRCAVNQGGRSRTCLSPPLLNKRNSHSSRREKNRGRQLRLVVEGASQIAARTAPLKEILRDKAAAGELIRQEHDRRYRTQAGLVDLLIENRHLRAGIDRRRAVDTFFALVNSATYELLVAQRGWTLAEWQTWIADVIEGELFGA